MNNTGARLDITLIRSETRPRKFIYRPRDRTLSPYDLSGKAFVMRIKAKGLTEIVYNAAPEISVTDAVNGEFTIDIPGATVEAYTFQNAPYSITIDGKRLLYGTLTIQSLYE